MLSINKTYEIKIRTPFPQVMRMHETMKVTSVLFWTDRSRFEICTYGIGEMKRSVVIVFSYCFIQHLHNNTYCVSPRWPVAFRSPLYPMVYSREKRTPTDNWGNKTAASYSHPRALDIFFISENQEMSRSLCVLTGYYYIPSGEEYGKSSLYYVDRKII